MGSRPRFRFYGVRPRDWREGGAAGLAYEITFVRAPDASERAALAAAFEDALAGTAVAAAGAWRWRGAWARLVVTPAWPPDGMMWETARHLLWDQFFSAIAEIMAALCDVVPLRQVVFVNAAASSKGAAGRWEEWSWAQCAPEGAPSWRDAGEDTVFEASRAVARARLDPTPWWEGMLEGFATLP
jgi:hypothetical protein